MAEPNGNGGRSRKAVVSEQLDSEIERHEKELSILRQARELLRTSILRVTHMKTSIRAVTKPGNPQTVAEAVELLLQEHTELHLDDIQRELEARFHIKITRKNLANTLNRWIARGGKFERPKANTFRLLQ